MATIIAANGAYNHHKIKQNALAEYTAKHTRIHSVADTYQNEPQFQTVENRSRNYARSGQQKFADPFAFNQKPYTWYFEGRNLDIYKTLKQNSHRDYPDVITLHKLKVVGHY